MESALKITVESTDTIREVMPGISARLWTGTDDHGVEVHAYLAAISPQTHAADVKVRYDAEFRERAPIPDTGSQVMGGFEGDDSCLHCHISKAISDFAQRQGGAIGAKALEAAFASVIGDYMASHPKARTDGGLLDLASEVMAKAVHRAERCNAGETTH